MCWYLLNFKSLTQSCSKNFFFKFSPRLFVMVFRDFPKLSIFSFLFFHSKGFDFSSFNLFEGVFRIPAPNSGSYRGRETWRPSTSDAPRTQWEEDNTVWRHRGTRSVFVYLGLRMRLFNFLMFILRNRQAIARELAFRKRCLHQWFPMGWWGNEQTSSQRRTKTVTWFGEGIVEG